MMMMMMMGDTTDRLYLSMGDTTDRLYSSIGVWFGLVSLFNGISTFVGYLIPKLEEQ